MVKQALKSLIILISLSGVVQADDIYRLIESGRLAEATDSVSARSTAAIRDGNTLFFQALLEKNGQRAAELLRASMKAEVSPEYQEVIYLRLAEYYFLGKESNRLNRLLVEYRSRWGKGKYWPRLLRFSVMVDQTNGDYESALKQIDRYLMDNSKRTSRHWGEIDKARVMTSFNKAIGARKILRGLSRERKGAGVSIALYALTEEAIKRKRTDDAVFFYNVLREGFPAAIGLNALVDRMSEMSETDRRSNLSDARSSTVYSVQVGVFSNQANARRMARTFKGYDQKVEIKSKTVSDKKYRAVYVGRFKSYDQADRFKKKLEANLGGVYQVVAR